ncbi:MAG: hypothetical protein ACOC1K_03445 [Nanoarchaeota archaeon]
MKSSEINKCIDLIDIFLRDNPSYEKFNKELNLSKILSTGSNLKDSENSDVKDNLIKIYHKDTDNSILTFSYTNFFGSEDKIYTEINYSDPDGNMPSIKGIPFNLTKIVLEYIFSLYSEKKDTLHDK